MNARSKACLPVPQTLDWNKALEEVRISGHTEATTVIEGPSREGIYRTRNERGEIRSWAPSGHEWYGRSEVFLRNAVETQPEIVPLNSDEILAKDILSNRGYPSDYTVWIEPDSILSVALGGIKAGRKTAPQEHDRVLVVRIARAIQNDAKIEERHPWTMVDRDGASADCVYMEGYFDLLSFARAALSTIRKHQAGE